MHHSNKELLAYEIAGALKDKEISLFLSFTDKYPEDLLREILAKVMAIPSHKIKKNRAALFVHLVNQYERSTKNYYRD